MCICVCERETEINLTWNSAVTVYLQHHYISKEQNVLSLHTATQKKNARIPVLQHNITTCSVRRFYPHLNPIWFYKACRTPTLAQQRNPWLRWAHMTHDLISHHLIPASCSPAIICVLMWIIRKLAQRNNQKVELLRGPGRGRFSWWLRLSHSLPVAVFRFQRALPTTLGKPLNSRCGSLWQEHSHRKDSKWEIHFNKKVE